MPESLVILAVVLIVVAIGLGLVLFVLIPRKDPKLAELDREREPLVAELVKNADPVEIADPIEAATREAAALVKQGKKIEAIKVYREKTGVRLAEAKAAVDRL